VEGLVDGWESVWGEDVRRGGGGGDTRVKAHPHTQIRRGWRQGGTR